ncbi:hypothetical protein [Ralstonia sp. TCR112]|nr:hypothetical protein [Ralstonia sp. TCR112]
MAEVINGMSVPPEIAHPFDALPDVVGQIHRGLESELGYRKQINQSA